MPLPPLPTPVPATGGVSAGGFVWYPQFTGESGSIFTSWPALYAALPESEPANIIFQSDTGTMTMPAGTYDMSNITWTAMSFTVSAGVPPGPRLQLILANGVHFSGLPCCIRGPLSVDYRGLSSACADLDLDDIPNNLSLRLYNCQIQCSGTQPFINLTTTTITTFILTMESGTLLYNPGGQNTVINVNGDVIVTAALSGSFITISDDAIGGDGAFQIINGSIGLQNSSGTWTMPSNQPNFTGTFSYNISASLPMSAQFALDPTVDDDFTLAYKPGDIWTNTISNRNFTCSSAGSGAAIWTPQLRFFSINALPGDTDDYAHGYYPGDSWWSEADQSFLVCTDNTTGFAVWLLIWEGPHLAKSEEPEEPITAN